MSSRNWSYLQETHGIMSISSCYLTHWPSHLLSFKTAKSQLCLLTQYTRTVNIFLYFPSKNLFANVEASETQKSLLEDFVPETAPRLKDTILVLTDLMHATLTMESLSGPKTIKTFMVHSLCEGVLYRDRKTPDKLLTSPECFTHQEPFEEAFIYTH